MQHVKRGEMEFEVFPGPATDKDGKTLLYVRPYSRIKYDIEGVDKYCHEHSQTSMDSVSQAFRSFLEHTALLMSDGSRIITPIGSFVPKLKLKGNFTDPDAIRGDDVELVGIEFTPSKKYFEALKKRIPLGFRKYKDLARRERVTDAEELEKILQRCIGNSYTTVNLFAANSGMKYSTAKNWLNAQCKGDNPRLAYTREGRTLHYYFRRPEDKKP